MNLVVPIIQDYWNIIPVDNVDKMNILLVVINVEIVFMVAEKDYIDPEYFIHFILLISLIT